MDIKTYEDLIDDWNELEAYRNLNGQPFDFGAGLITDDSKESEDVYWKIQQWDIEHALDHLDCLEYKRDIRKQKRKRRKTRSKDIDNRKLKKLASISWFPVYYDEDKNKYVHCYVSRRRGYAKWLTNKVMRNTNDFKLKGNGYRRLVGYWYILF
jgi:hypothetical protein